MPKLINYDEDARAAMKRGMDALAEAVKTTLGPKGRNVALDKKYGSPTVTHDGVTVARDIELDDPFENMGAQLLKEAATKTEDVAGDGTTTATVLAQAIVTEGLKNVASGANPMQMKFGIDKAAETVAAADQGRRPAGQGPRRYRPGGHRQRRRQRDRQPDRGGDGQGRQGWRDHGRGVAHDGLRDGVRRGHAVRPRLHQRLLRHRRQPHGGRPRRPLHPDHRQEDQRHRRHAADAREDPPVGQEGAADHRRGCRWRGALDARRQQAARRDQHPCRQGARLWRSTQGDAA